MEVKKTPIVEFEGDQLEIDFSGIDFDLDRPQFSICPKCSSDLIRLAEGCGICGWSESQSPPSTKKRKQGYGGGYIEKVLQNRSKRKR